MEIISVDQKLINYQKSTHWECSHSQGKHRILRIPTFTLRSLASAYESFYRLMIRAVEDRTIVWSDSANAVGEIRDLLWMCCVIRVRTIDEWKTCLIAPYPKSAPSIDWLYWVAERTVENTLLQKNNIADLEAIVEAYEDTCPHARGLIPIALMSSVVRLTNIKHYSWRNLNHDNYATIFKILSNSDSSEVMQEWLVGTSEWIDLYRGKKAIDLLTVFTQRVKILVKQGAFKRDAFYEHAINFVEELRKRREAISSGSSEG